MHLVTEGILDEAAAKAVMKLCGLKIASVRGRKGKGWIDKNLAAFNAASAFESFIVVRDMDNDADCPMMLVKRLVPNKADKLHLRIAAKSIESWILADAEGVAKWLSVPIRSVPANTDAISDPKDYLLKLGQRPSKSRRRPLFYDEGDYTSRTLEFLNSKWSAKRAYEAQRSNSLNQMIDRLRSL